MISFIHIYKILKDQTSATYSLDLSVLMTSHEKRESSTTNDYVLTLLYNCKKRWIGKKWQQNALNMKVTIRDQSNIIL